MDPKCDRKRLVCVFVFVVFVAILFNGNFLAYLAGRCNSFWLVRAVVLLWFPMVVLGAISLIVPLRFLYRGIREARSSVLPLYIVAASTVIIFVGSFCAHDQWWVRHTCGLRDRMTGILTVEKVDHVRTWLAELPDGGNSYPQEIESHDFPLPAKDIKFASVYLSLEEVQGASVRVVVLSWGGGFLGPWSVTIGPQNMKCPINTKRTYTLSVSPGVFVRHNVG